MPKQAKSPIERFGWLGLQVLADPELRPRDRDVALILAMHANSETGQAYPGTERIAQMTGLDPKNVWRHLRRLMDRGHILAIRGGGRRRATGYALIIRSNTSLDLSRKVSHDEVQEDHKMAVPEPTQETPNSLTHEAETPSPVRDQPDMNQVAFPLTHDAGPPSPVRDQPGRNLVDSLSGHQPDRESTASLGFQRPKRRRMPTREELNRQREALQKEYEDAGRPLGSERYWEHWLKDAPPPSINPNPCDGQHETPTDHDRRSLGRA